MLRLKICFPLKKINETTMITKINNNSKRTRLLPVYSGYLFLKIHYFDKNELMSILGGSSKTGKGFKGAETNCDD